MKPQLRSFDTITSEAIWWSSTHWMFLDRGCPHPVWTHARSLSSVRQCVYAKKQTMVYPFAYDSTTGEITPIPWPVTEGEEEIEEWRDIPHEGVKLIEWPAGINRPACWVIHTGTGGRWQVDARPGLHPAPRKGKSGPVWVWEANR